MAVSVGFEPTESFPSRAFEARSFGRSDTTPRQRLPVAMVAKELGQLRHTLTAQHAGYDLNAKGHAGVSDDIPQRARGTCLLVVRAKNEARHSTLSDRASAHRTRF